MIVERKNLFSPNNKVFDSLSSRLGLDPQFQISKAVVSSDAVLVVDSLSRKKSSSNRFFHYNNVFPKPSPAGLDFNIPFLFIGSPSSNRFGGRLIAVDTLRTILRSVVDQGSTFNTGPINQILPSFVRAGTTSGGIIRSFEEDPTLDTISSLGGVSIMALSTSGGTKAISCWPGVAFGAGSNIHNCPFDRGNYSVAYTKSIAQVQEEV